MIKNQTLAIFGFIIALFIVYILHTNLLESNIRFPSITKTVYIFLGSFTIVICIVFLLATIFKKFDKHLGFLYLFSVPIKVLLFFLVFKESFLEQTFSSNNEAINLLTPIVLTLIFEVFFMSKLLNNFNTSKNEK